MTESTGKSSALVVVSLAAYRAKRATVARQAVEPGRRLVALRLPTPREVAHRRRMLEHLARAPALER
jgi:hypothetical protein